MTVEVLKEEESSRAVERSETSKRAVLVVGMHRSGTSAVASVVAELGFHFGSAPMPPSSENPRGYFEDQRIVDLHDRLLEACGRTWSDPRSLPDDCFEGRTAERARDNLALILDRDFLDRRSWLIKDPRLCRLLPLWDELLEKAAEDTEVGFLHVFRSPAAVARSLRARDGISWSRSLLLWLVHCLEGEKATRGKRRAWIRFEDLLEEREETLQRALGRLSVSAESSRLKTAFDAVFDPNLVHHVSSVGEGTDHPWLLAVEEAMRTLCTAEDEAAFRSLDEIGEQLEVAQRLLLSDGWVWATEHHQERYEVVSRRIEQNNRHIEHLGNLLALSLRGGGEGGEDQLKVPEQLLEPFPRAPDLAQIAREVATRVTDELALSEKVTETLALARRLEGETAAANTRWAEANAKLDRARRKLASLELEQQVTLRQKRELAEELEATARQQSETETELNRYREQLEQSQALSSTATERIEQARLDTAETRGDLERAQRELVEVAHERDMAREADRLARQQVELLESSFSWRATRPLRWFRGLFS